MSEQPPASLQSTDTVAETVVSSQDVDLGPVESGGLVAAAALAAAGFAYATRKGLESKTASENPDSDE